MIGHSGGEALLGETMRCGHPLRHSAGSKRQEFNTLKKKDHCDCSRPPVCLAAQSDDF